jgi:hypothetical protein
MEWYLCKMRSTVDSAASTAFERYSGDIVPDLY